MRSKRFLITGAILIVIILIVAAGFLALISVRLQQRFSQSATNYSGNELYSRAVAQVDSGNYKSAEEYLQQALQKQEDPTYRNQLAVVQYRLQKYPEAVASYQQLIDEKQDVAFAWNGMGNAYRDWADQDKDQAQKSAHQDLAVSAYRSSLQEDAHYVAAYSNLALLLNGEGNTKDALTTLDVGIAKTQEPALQKIKDSLQATPAVVQ